MREVARSAVNSVEPLLVARRQHLTVDLPEGPCWVDADSVRLEQVLTNLLHNASKYTDPEGKIDLRVEAAGHSVVLRLKDNGIGIDPEYKDRIFVIFQRLHGKEDYEGTGIGLAICKKIVERHGGRIWVESKQRVGSAFHFIIPDSEGGQP